MAFAFADFINNRVVLNGKQGKRSVTLSLTQTEASRLCYDLEQSLQKLAEHNFKSEK